MSPYTEISKLKIVTLLNQQARYSYSQNS